MTANLDFDFADGLHGAVIEVEIHVFSSPKAKFDNLDALTAQMVRDCDVAKALLS